MNSRRHFLQTIGLSALALQLSNISCQNKKDKVTIKSYKGPILRVAIMGIGSYGNIVAKAMQSCSKAKLTGVISGSPEKIEEWKTKYNIPLKNIYDYENFENIKNNPEIDAIYVIVPNFLHKEYVLKAAKTGKHIICEKPLGLNAREGEEMVEACKSAGVKLLVGYRMHFEPKNLEIISMRNNGEFGKIRYFTGNGGYKIGDPTQWRLDRAKAGGGSLMDIGIYAVNGARYMIGEDPIWVTAQEVKTDHVKFKEGVDESITFQFGFPSGAFASCLSTFSMNNVDRFLMIGDNGYAELLPANGYGPLEGLTHKGYLKAVSPPMQQTLQMDEMSSILLENKIPVVPVNGEEGVKDLKIIEAIYLAVKTGKKISINIL